MQHVPHGRRQDLRVEVGVVVVDRADLADQLHAVGPDVVEAADERRNEGRPGLGGEQRLVRGEAQGHVDHRAFVAQGAAGLEAVHRQRHLDGHVLGDTGEEPPLFQHALGIEGRHFGTHRPGNDVADLGDDLLEIALGLGDQRGIGRHAIDEARRCQLADFRHVGGIDKELHVSSPSRRQAALLFALCSPQAPL